MILTGAAGQAPQGRASCSDAGRRASLLRWSTQDVGLGRLGAPPGPDRSTGFEGMAKEVPEGETKQREHLEDSHKTKLRLACHRPHSSQSHRDSLSLAGEVRNRIVPRGSEHHRWRTCTKYPRWSNTNTYIYILYRPILIITEGVAMGPGFWFSIHFHKY